MSLKPTSNPPSRWQFLVLAAGLLAGFFPALLASVPVETRVQAVLVWGTDDAKPTGKALKELDPKLREKLGKIFKWQNYFEVSRQNAGVLAGKAQGIKLTYMPFFIKAACFALKEFPWMNSSVTPAGDALTLKRYYNIGIAVALDPSGLIVPVLKNAEDLSLSGIAKAANDLAGRARGKKLGPADAQDATFTITNPGIFGALFGLPIISQPQVAILGCGTVEKVAAVVEGDAIAIRSQMYLALTFDHRLIDGALGDQFYQKVKSVLENWSEEVL